ncbi:MAG: glycoside hydrolase family 38 C-terminal domain-containing protein [Tessaracoccus sp.]
MHENQSLTVGRVTRVLAERLRPAIYSDPHPLELAAHVVDGEPIPVADGLAAEYQPTEVGARWGRAWDTTWFRLRGQVPESFAGRRVEIVADLGFDPNLTGFQCEGLVYRADGTPVRSLNPRAQWIPVGNPVDGGEQIEFFVEAGSNPVLLDYHPFLPTEQGDVLTASPDPLYRIRRVDVCIFEEEVFELVHDVEVLVQLAEQLPEESARRGQILRALDRALNRVDLQRIVATTPAAREELREVLAAPAGSSAHRLTAVGHAHIDSAWLWPLRETVRKVARTSSSMVTLLDENPDFVYAMSSAQQYDWLKKQRPEVYARVKQAVADGRFVPIGGMWIEPDAVLPSGESFIRQISFGQRFFRDEFGVECRGAWLPDSFGYSGALPQLLVGSGFEWFLTQKISWNQVNRFPHHTFHWEGIDGSRVFTHFPPMDTYNAQLSGEEVAKAVRQFREKSVARSSLAPMGWGDGGGGTTREMLARAERMADLEGAAQVVLESPNDFFDRAMAELPDPDVWRGELYLELHRGTFTTQHRTKQGNRTAQRLLAEAELWATAAARRAGFAYPYDELDELWRETLLLQFHDILPGTSIAWVHREAEESYAAIAERCEAIVADALAALGVRLDAEGELLVNPAPVAVGGVAGLSVAQAPSASAPSTTPPTPTSAPAAIQENRPMADFAVSDAENRPLADFSGLPGGASASVGTVARVEDGFVLESSLARVIVDEAGHVVSMLDLTTGREAITPGQRGNLLQLHQDFPNMWDAWDVDRHYLDMREDLDGAAEVRIDGPSVVVRREFGSSWIEQRLSLDVDGRTLLIDCDIDWQEQEKFLKLAFPVDVFTDEVLAETQFGYQKRANHENTSWEDARFETHAQRWFLVQEAGFGVAFLNESSHGFDVTRVHHDAPTSAALSLSPTPPTPAAIQENRPMADFAVSDAENRPQPGSSVSQLARFSLLRAPKFPDPRADLGRHHLRLGVQIGADVRSATQAGWRIDSPSRRATGAEVAPVVTSSNAAVIVGAVKLADDQSGDAIVRVYEGAAVGVFPGSPSISERCDVVATDLIERDQQEIPAGRDDQGRTTFDVQLRPFEVRTFRLFINRAQVPDAKVCGGSLCQVPEVPFEARSSHLRDHELGRASKGV